MSVAIHKLCILRISKSSAPNFLVPDVLICQRVYIACYLNHLFVEAFLIPVFDVYHSQGYSIVANGGGVCP
jgi:hypothetical protein